MFRIHGDDRNDLAVELFISRIFVSLPDVLPWFGRSFGDQNRAYLRGQLTVQKISRKVDSIWRHCHHLSDYAYRIDVSFIVFFSLNAKLRLILI